MATYPGHEITTIPVNVANGIPRGKKVIYQNIGEVEVYLVQSAVADDGKPNKLRGRQYADSATFAVGNEPIWAFTRGGKSELAVRY